MCGIIGYTGKKDAAEILLEGLAQLEYRGYDSAGVAVFSKGGIALRKTEGKVERLKRICLEAPVKGNMGIGHTRWATHGTANTVNSHPHTNLSSTIAVVHNGIIENHHQLREFLEGVDYRFVSETDTEVIPHLLDYHIREDKDFFKAFLKTVNSLNGSFAISAIYAESGNKIFSARRGSPLVVAQGDGESFLSSDMNSLPSGAKNVYVLEDNEICVLDGGELGFFDFCGNEISKHPVEFVKNIFSAQENHHQSYMIKEIYEQPHVVRRILEKVNCDGSIKMENVEKADVEGVDKIYIVACGTAYHASMAGKLAIEYLAGINTEAEVASEFCCREPIINKKTLIIAVTQSGETADTLSAIRLAKEKDAKVVAITNTPYSTATVEADFALYTDAGREVSVASTKAYTAQLAMLFSFALFLAECKTDVDKSRIKNFKKSFMEIPSKLEKTLLLDKNIEKLSDEILEYNNIFYIGRGIDYVTAAEGALKMKEITYLNCQAYPAGELKHGPIAVADENTLTVAVSLSDRLHHKTLNNIREITARKADAICLFCDGTDEYNITILLPETEELLSPFTGVIPMQLLAYYVAQKKGYDVDKPRNLAKSVTVE